MRQYQTTNVITNRDGKTKTTENDITTTTQVYDVNSDDNFLSYDEIVDAVGLG